MGAGRYPTFATAADRMVRVDKVYDPDPEAHRQYAFYLERYMEIWPQMREIVHRTVAHACRL